MLRRLPGVPSGVTSGRVPSGCLVELVLAVHGPAFLTEPAVRMLRRTVDEAEVLPPFRQFGGSTSQELGNLCVTLRCLVDAVDLLEAAELCGQRLRSLVLETAPGIDPAVSLVEHSVRAIWH